MHDRGRLQALAHKCHSGIGAGVRGDSRAAEGQNLVGHAEDRRVLTAVSVGRASTEVGLVTVGIETLFVIELSAAAAARPRPIAVVALSSVDSSLASVRVKAEE